MITMNQIAGTDGFSIMDNLRLVVIAAIFIIVVFIYLLYIMKNRGRTKQRYSHAINSYDRGSREEKHEPGVVEDFFSIEDTIKSRKTEAMEDIEEESVDNLEDFEADIKGIKDEITANVGKLTLKIEEGDKEVVKKVETVIETKINEAIQSQVNSTVSALERLADSLRTEISTTGEYGKSLEEKAERAGNKGVLENLVASLVEEALKAVNLRISKALQSQKNATAKVLDEMTNSLRNKDESSGILPSGETEETAEENIESEEESEITGEDNDILEGLASSLRAKEGPTGFSFSDKFKTADKEQAVPDVVKYKESFEAKTATGKIEEEVSEKTPEESDDLDLENLFKEEYVGFSSSGKSKDVAGEKSADAMTTSGNVEEERSEKDGETKKKAGEMEDLDIQDFLEELGLPPSEKDLKSDRG